MNSFRTRLAATTAFAALFGWQPSAQDAPAPAPEPDTATEAPAADAPATRPPGEAPDAGATDADTGSGEAPADGTARAARPAVAAEVGSDWPYYGGSSSAQRYSPLDQITPENVGRLQRAFVYRTGDLPSAEAEGKYAAETTPLKLGDRLYMCSAKNVLIAIDAATGDEAWRYDPGVSDDAIPYSASCRGVSAYQVPDANADEACATRIVEGTLDARLIAVDARTGTPCADFGDDGQVDLWDGIGEKVPGWYAVTAPPMIVRGQIVTGAQVKDGQAEDAPSGVIRAFDAVTGQLTWAWDMGNPDNSKGPPEGETYTRGTPNLWTAGVADEELGMVYLPLGNSSVDYYAGNRSQTENDWSTSLVALDVATGTPVWSFQTVRIDVWDYDLGSQPTLVDFPAEGGTVKAIVLPSKQGDIYVLNRETGESLFPVDEIEVPAKGEIEPDVLSDTQPVSGYANLRHATELRESDMWGFSPIDQMYCRIMFRQANYDGFFTPPSADKPYIQYPGYNGGSDWGSVALDPERGLLIANYNDIPNYNRLVPREEADEKGWKPIYEKSNSGQNAEGAGDPQTGAPYAIQVNAGWRSPLTDMPCTAPPYGHIRAIELATGKTVWDKPLGEARRNGPWGIPSMLPLTIGTPNNGGSVVTKGGLIFIAAATDNMFRAIDVETGEVVWEDELPAGGQANPIVYEVGGKEYVMIAATGHHFMETGVGDAMIAYALPD